ncbi:MAG TPA: GNAT family N-acetyltransferase [Allosphingosinicella sp.]|nr:GNAT family N-acetyltransferase [Allosphingosinicella sp.]
MDAVAAVWHESASRMDGAVADMPTREALRQHIDAELRSDWHLYVALRDEHVVGMLALKPQLAVLDQIFVAPDEQGRGVGRAMLDLAKQLMPSGFTLRMDAANNQARRFYEAQGLTKLDEGTHPWTGKPVHFYGWMLTASSTRTRC